MLWRGELAADLLAADLEAGLLGPATLTRAGAWTPRQRQRLSQLDPGTWAQAAAGASPGRQDDSPSHPAIEIAIYPDVIRLAAHTLRARHSSNSAAL